MKTMWSILTEENRHPTQDELAEFYEEQAAGRPSDGWTPSNQHIDEKFGRTRFAIDYIFNSDKVLEVGCQDGGMSQHLSRAAGSGSLDLCDIAETYLKRATKFLHDKGLQVRNCYLGDACFIDFGDTYDVIVAMEILEHVPDPRQLLRNLYKHLVHGGKILVTVPVDWRDDLGEHLHNFTINDLIQIIGESTGIKAPIWREWDWFFSVIKKGSLKYESVASSA